MLPHKPFVTRVHSYWQAREDSNPRDSSRGLPPRDSDAREPSKDDGRGAPREPDARRGTRGLVRAPSAREDGKLARHGDEGRGSPATESGRGGPPPPR